MKPTVFNFFLEMQSPIQWPSVMICLMPAYKNKSANDLFAQKSFEKSFESQDEFDEMGSKVFFDQHEDFLRGLFFGENYPDNDIKVEEPLAEINQEDYERYGKCLTISLELARQQLIEQGKMKSNQMDDDFIANFIFVLPETTKKMAINLLAFNETFYTGSQQKIYLERGKLIVHHVEPQLYQYIRNFAAQTFKKPLL